MSQAAITLRRERAISAEGLALITQLLSELDARYGPVAEPSFTPNDIRGVAGAVFVIALAAETPVGCGALRPLEPGVAEVKRMYVAPTFRGQRVAQAILGELERFAAEQGYRLLRLETGNRQPEAVRLYERCGYARIPCFGPYAGLPWSICFEKRINGIEDRGSRIEDN